MLMGIGICNNNNCKYSQTCNRFLTKQGELMNFSAICSKETNYKWYWKTEVNIVKKDGVL